MKSSKKMQKGILKVVSPWTKDLAECDGRNLSGVAITISYGNETPKEFHRDFYDYAEIIIQDVRWDGYRSRHERVVYYVTHAGEINVM